MTDRRRINGPPSGTYEPVFTAARKFQTSGRSRKPNQLRKIYLETGVVSSATGSAYLEIQPSSAPRKNTTTSSLKLSCAIHGPKPLHRNAVFSPNLQVNVTVKYAPFATRQRRGYIRDSLEREVGIQLETALNGVLILDRWPKSSLDIVITVLEAEDGAGLSLPQQQEQTVPALSDMNVVSGCITAASAALLDAKIDCFDLISGGVAATFKGTNGDGLRVLDPSPSEDGDPCSACVVGYMASRDEMTLTWAKGDVSGGGFDGLLDNAINAAKGSLQVLRQVAIDLAKAEKSDD